MGSVGSISYAFDDGNMPSYQHERSGVVFPYYGLQDVRSIRVAPDTARDELMAQCRARCRAPKFAVIDAYQDLPSGFLQGLLAAANAGDPTFAGCTIHTCVHDDART